MTVRRVLSGPSAIVADARCSDEVRVESCISLRRFLRP